MKKKLDYRVYLGGREASDFNVFGNTNYNYTVNFNHTGIPANDGRALFTVAQQPTHLAEVV